MNSLEAFNNIKNRNNSIVKSIVSDDSNIVLYPKEEIDIIEKDLLVFNEIKKVLDEYGLSDYYRYIDDNSNDNNISYKDFFELIRYPQNRKSETDIRLDTILNVVSRICKDETNYINPDYYDNKLYIDGCTEYKSDTERDCIERWLDNIFKDKK